METTGLNLDKRKEELFRAIDTKQNRMMLDKIAISTEIKEMEAQFEQSIHIIINLSNIVAAFNDFILEIEEKIKGMQEIPIDDLERLRTRMSSVSADLQTKIMAFTDTLNQRKKMGQGIVPPPPPPASYTIR